VPMECICFLAPHLPSKYLTHNDLFLCRDRFISACYQRKVMGAELRPDMRRWVDQLLLGNWMNGQWGEETGQEMSSGAKMPWRITCRLKKAGEAATREWSPKPVWEMWRPQERWRDELFSCSPECEEIESWSDLQEGHYFSYYSSGSL
jgi:hypothetical protein